MRTETCIAIDTMTATRLPYAATVVRPQATDACIGVHVSVLRLDIAGGRRLPDVQSTGTGLLYVALLQELKQSLE